MKNIAQFGLSDVLPPTIRIRTTVSFGSKGKSTQGTLTGVGTATIKICFKDSKDTPSTNPFLAKYGNNWLTQIQLSH